MFFLFQPINFLFAALGGRPGGLSLSSDDIDLMTAIAKGDEPALEIFYERYKGLVYSLSLQMLNDPGLSEEVTLDVFNQIWQRATAYRSSRSAVKTWLVCITRNRAIDMLRMRRSRLDCNLALWADEELNSLPGASNPELETTHLDMRQKVFAALAELPEEQRSVLALAYFKGLSHGEIAEKLQQPLGTVKGRIRIAMRTLQQKFAEKV